jgi:hypothetical protein
MKCTVSPRRQGLRGDGPRLHRLRPEAGGGAAASARRLRRRDAPGHRTTHEGTILEGTKTDHGEPDAGRVVLVPATLAWMLEAQINLHGPDCQLIFPTPRGRLWRERIFYRDLWEPTQETSGSDIRPHECRRHSYVTHLSAAGVNDADLVEIVGHPRGDDALQVHACSRRELRSNSCAAIG